MSKYVSWLRELAEKGGKGVVNNIDARCLGRIADELEQSATQATDIHDGRRTLTEAEDQIERLNSRIVELLRERDSELQAALEFGIWSCAGPTNDAEVEM